VDGEVVPQPPGLGEERSDGYGREPPIGEDPHKLRGARVINDTGENVTTKDLGDLDVEVLDQSSASSPPVPRTTEARTRPSVVR
jgi:hypothetical protein